MRTKAEEIAAAVERTLATPIFNVNLGNFNHIDCVCGRNFKRREGSFTAKQEVICPNVDCRRIWDVLSEDRTNVHFK